MKETDLVAERYARREQSGAEYRYSMLNPAVWQGVQERQRALIALLTLHAPKPVADLSVMEIGCGSGGNLLELLRLGFSPENISGNELLPQRYQLARKNLPSAIHLVEGDALELSPPSDGYDIVYQSTVFSSILDQQFQSRLADEMWKWTKPGGAVLWYDFTFNNPNNPDVHGVPLSRVRELFPEAHIDARRVTLAPPISRRVCRIHPNAYHVFNSLPFLRTHVLCWLEKKY